MALFLDKQFNTEWLAEIEYLDMVDLELRYKGLNRISHEAIYKR